ncbi:MAG: hypothetical protein ACJ8IK_09390 [Burkholderiaceae bacterium]
MPIRNRLTYLLFACLAFLTLSSRASVQNEVPVDYWWGYADPDHFSSAAANCAAVVARVGGSGSTVSWSYDSFNNTMGNLCTGKDGNGTRANFGFMRLHGTCPPGTDGPNQVGQNRQACTISCAYGKAYNSLAGACTPVIDKSFYTPCPTCFGEPIYPLNGAKRQSVALGLSIGWMPISIAYDSTPLVPQDDYNAPFEVATPPSFGDLWQSNLHRSLALQPSTAASGAQVGSQYSAVVLQRGGTSLETASVSGSNDCSSAGSGGSIYVPTVNRAEKLTLAGADSAGMLIDQKALTEEVYDATGAITSASRATGGKLTYVYTAGLLTSVTDQFGRAVQFGYEQPGDASLPKRINLLTAPDGSQVQVGYTTTNMLQTLTWADSNVQTFVYSSPVSSQLLTNVLDENHATYSTTTYDSNGLAQSTYEGTGQNKYSVTYTTPPAWQTTTVAVNASYVCREHRFMPPAGTVMTGPNSETINIDATQVNGSAYLSTMSQPAGSGSAVSSSLRTYDTVGNILSSDDFNGNRSCFAYDTARSLQTVSVEGLPGAASASPKACPANLSSYSPSTADAAHPERKVTTVWHPDWVLKTREAAPKKITTWVYNGQPDPIIGGTASCAPTAPALPDGKPIAVVCVRYEQATTDATGALGLSATVTGATRAWSYTYDQFGQVLTATTPKQSPGDALSHTTTYVYYPDTSMTGNAGHTIGDLQSVTNPLQQTTNFTSYDGAGRLLSSSDANGVVTTQTYWPRGWLKSLKVTPPGSATPQLTTYDYWPTGLLKTVTLPDASTLNYAYDDAHRLTDITDAVGNKLHYVLDNAGNPMSEQISDASGNLASTVSRVFDALNRVQSQTGLTH